MKLQTSELHRLPNNAPTNICNLYQTSVINFSDKRAGNQLFPVYGNFHDMRPDFRRDEFHLLNAGATSGKHSRRHNPLGGRNHMHGKLIRNQRCAGDYFEDRRAVRRHQAGGFAQDGQRRPRHDVNMPRAPLKTNPYCRFTI